MTSADTTPPPSAKGRGETNPGSTSPAPGDAGEKAAEQGEGVAGDAGGAGPEPAGDGASRAGGEAAPTADDEAAPAAKSESASAPAPGKPKRAGSRLRRPNPVRDMAISLGVLVVPLLILMAFCRPDEADVETIDPTGTYRSAAAEAKYPVRKPAGLPGGWRSTNAAIERETGGGLTLRVSYITPSKEFIQLVESDVPSDKLIPDEIGGGKVHGRIQIGEAQWQRYAGRNSDETALVLLDPKVTIVVTGDAPMGELTAFAALLR